MTSIDPHGQVATAFRAAAAGTAALDNASGGGGNDDDAGQFLVGWYLAAVGNRAVRSKNALRRREAVASLR